MDNSIVPTLTKGGLDVHFPTISIQVGFRAIQYLPYCTSCWQHSNWAVIRRIKNKAALAPEHGS